MNSKLLLSGLAAGALSLLAGCAVEPVAYVPGPPPPPPVYGGGYYGPHTTIVYDRYGAPPPVIVENRPPPPVEFRAVWVGGHWRWNGRRYIWARGHYRRV